MRKLLIATLAIAAGTSLAWAQGTGQGIGSPPGAPLTTPPAIQTAPSGSAGTAPVGHRQPRRADVPEAGNSAPDAGLGPTAEDRALDRKIKSICRGC